MATKPTYSVKFRRRREGKTNYRKRIKLLLSEKPRLVVRKSNRYIIAQIATFDPKGDRIEVCAWSRELNKFGWPFPSFKNLPAAYLTGYLVGKRAIKKGIKEAILDIGLYPSTKGSRLYAVLKGALDAGLKIPHSPDILPSEERIFGKHIEKFLKIVKDSQDKYKNQFNSYFRDKVDKLNIEEIVKKVKSNIDKNA